MTMTEEVYAQALLLAGELGEREAQRLNLLCDSAVRTLAARLRKGLLPEDCREEFLLAASLYALGALGSTDSGGDIQEFRAGDLTVKQGSSGKDAASRCLEKQADRLMAPFLGDSFQFQGV